MAIRLPSAYQAPLTYSPLRSNVSAAGTSYQRTLAMSPVRPEQCSVSCHQAAYIAGGAYGTACAGGPRGLSQPARNTLNTATARRRRPVALTMGHSKGRQERLARETSHKRPHLYTLTGA